MDWGSGSKVTIGDLLVEADVGLGGWRYRISRNGKKIVDRDPCLPGDQCEELARAEAVRDALEILGRNDDSETLAKALQWEPLNSAQNS